MISKLGAVFGGQFKRVATALACAGGVLFSPVAGQARDINSFGGNGGGEFRIQCEPGDFLVGFDVMASHVINRIAPVCGNAKRGGTYGRPWIGGQAGTLAQPRCEPGGIITILHVFADNTPLVNRLGFTCWNPTNTRVTNTLPTFGGVAGKNLRIICGDHEIATGIYGRAGTAIDRLGLICDPIPRPAPPAQVGGGQPATPGGGSATLGGRLVAFAQSSLGWCVPSGDPTRAKVRGICGPKEGIAPGECTDLVSAAIEFAGARRGDFRNDPFYVWGTRVGPPYLPGDVIQYVNTVFRGPGITFGPTPKHTAIIERANGTQISLLEQHAPERVVTRSSLDLSWLAGGEYRVYRPIPK